MTDVFGHPWLGALFGDCEIAALWSSEAQLDHFRAFEAAYAMALEATGKVPSGQGSRAADTVMKAEIDIASLAEGTSRDGLPIPELVRQLRAAAGPDAAAIHTGATSQDVLDTALALTLRAVTTVLIARLQALDGTLTDLAARHGDAPLMGRTRMQAALPITVGDRVETWRRPIHGHIAALSALRAKVERLQLGGAVGNRAQLGETADTIAAQIARRLDLSDGPVWHTDRTAIADYVSRLSLISGSLGKIGQDIVLMAQQGIDEVTLKGGGGSSAMPHKSNPVLAELQVTLARYNATQLSGMHHALVHEQERSGAAWMLEWMILPPMTVATARGLAACRQLVSDIEHVGTR